MDLHRRLKLQKLFNKWRSNVIDRKKQSERFELKNLKQKVLDLQDEYRHEYVTRDKFQRLHQRASKSVIQLEEKQRENIDVVKDLREKLRIMQPNKILTGISNLLSTMKMYDVNNIFKKFEPLR